jgi:hypothetical protein
MTPMPHRIRPQGTRRALIALAATALSLFTIPGTAWGSPATADQATSPAAAYLTTHPGGQLLNRNEVSYRAGAGTGTLIVTLATPGAITAVPNCPAGWFCFWDEPSFGGNRGKLSSCYWQSLATYHWDYRIASAYYNLNNGAVQFRNGNTPLFQIGVTDRSIPSAGTNNYLATSVYRYC